MNQDFIVPASPGLARRLVTLAKMARVNLDPQIVALAGTGLIAAWPPDLNARQRAAIQFLADHAWRGIVIYHKTVEMQRTLLRAARIAGKRPLIIVSDSHEWLHRASRHGFVAHRLTAEYEFAEGHEVILADDFNVFNNSLLRKARNALVVIDDFTARDVDVAAALCIEFVSVVFTAQRDEATRGYRHFGLLRNPSGHHEAWYQNALIGEIASRLHPQSSIGEALIANDQGLGELMARGMMLPHPTKLARIMGVSAHLMGDPNEKETSAEDAAEDETIF